VSPAPSRGPLAPLVTVAVAVILLAAGRPIGVTQPWLTAAFGLPPPPGGRPAPPAARTQGIATPVVGTAVLGTPVLGTPVAQGQVARGPAARPGAGGTGAGGTVPRAPAGTGRPVPGWQRPVDGPSRIGRPFEAPTTPYGPGHRGVDLIAAVGAPVRAAADGEVTFAGLVAGRGVVTLRHGRLRTTYEPVGPTVRLGQRVRAGQVIGLLVGGHPGCPATACLHWGLLTDQGYLDPLMLLARPAPRLLPLATLR
jgi:murein DD-endopeptidase MepM/ murein hydrolase activator NlpD